MLDRQFVLNLANQIANFQQRNNGYLARQEIERLHSELCHDEKRLEPFGFKVYSQGDEDGIIEEICRRLKMTLGTFFEIGVENGLECNSLYLIHRGWKGCWIEGNQNYCDSIQKKFASIIPRRLQLFSKTVSVDNINLLIVEAGFDRNNLDFLSIDIDGNDIYLLECLEHFPKIICIEYNARFPGNLIKKQVYDPKRFWQETDYFGSSLSALCEAADKKGYRLVGTNITGTNAFFVRSDLVENLFCENCSPESLYNPPRYWLIFDHYRCVGHPPDFGPYADLTE